MADGNEYNLFQIKEKGGPVEIVYPTEGTPLIVGPKAVFKDAPNPNAARLFQCYCFTPECQQLIVDFGGCARCIRWPRRSRGRKPFAQIKTMKEDPDGGREDERGDQGALQQALRGVSLSEATNDREDVRESDCAVSSVVRTA